MKYYRYTILIFFPLYVGAYETPTHSILTTQAVQASVLDIDPDFLPDLGLDFTTHDAFLPSQVPANPDGTDPDSSAWLGRTSIIRIISGGAVMEDAGKRSRHHFYDPQNDRGSGSAGHRSPDWILESVVLPHSNLTVQVTLPGQDYSYGDALGYFYESLTLSDEYNRLINAGLLFRSLGHVIHHIQDMVQPQHVRNDAHCDATTNFPGVALLCLLAGQHNPSFYEKYTNQRISSMTLAHPGVFPEGMQTVRDFWDNASGSGAAQFTSFNFVSDATNFQSQDGEVLIPHPEYPSPVPLQELVSVELSQLLLDDPFLTPAARQLVLSRTGCRIDFKNECFVDFIQSRGIRGEGHGQSMNIMRASTISIFDEELRSRNIEVSNPDEPAFITRRLITLNRYNFEAVYPFLLPFAVSYSAGLIDYFFRGRLDVVNHGITDNLSTLITVQNISATGNHLQLGDFELYYDSIDGGRKKLPYSLQGNGVPVKVGDTVTLKTTLPDDVDNSIMKPYLVVFDGRQGRIGHEPGIAASRFQLPISGHVSAQLSGVFVCPQKIYGIRILFHQQPENDGRVLLRGVDSMAQFDFRNVQPGNAIVKDEARWRHGIDESTGGYIYEVTYNFPEAEINTCIAPSLGPWQLGEDVIAE